MPRMTVDKRVYRVLASSRTVSANGRHSEVCRSESGRQVKDFVVAAILRGIGLPMEFRHLRYFVAVAEERVRSPRNGGCTPRTLPQPTDPRA